MGLIDALKETPAVEIKTTTLYDLLDRSARLEYLQRAIIFDVNRDQITNVFKLKSIVENQQEEDNGDSE